MSISACSVCWGRGRTIDGKPCPCGCLPTFVVGIPEDYRTLTYQQLQQQIATLTRQRDLAVEALELIAAPKRPDGTYNRCREACERLAKEALSTIKESK